MNGYYKGERVTQDYTSKNKEQAIEFVKKYLKERFGEDVVIDDADITIEFTHKLHANNSRDEELKTVTVTVDGVEFNATVDSQRSMAAALLADLPEYEWIGADNEIHTVSKETLQRALKESHQATTEIWTRYRDIKNNLEPYPQEE